MSHIKAIFRRGVFEPLEPVKLREEQPVQLSFEASEDQRPQFWLAQVRALHAAVIERRGPLPDSAVDIAADRLR